MAEYVTLIEAAELEDVKYNTMVRRITRNPDKFDTMTEKSENGGKDAVLVAIASLSKKARNAWKERAKLKELSGTISPEGEAQPEPEAPWYVEADVDWYIENYREQWYKGMELGNVIREFLQYDGANKTEYAEQYAQEHLGSGKRTVPICEGIQRSLCMGGQASEGVRCRVRVLQGAVPVPEAQRVRYLPKHQAGGQTGDQEHMVQRRLCGKPWNP